MHTYFFLGMFSGVLLFFLVVSTVPTQAIQPHDPSESHKLYRSTPAHAPSALIEAQASAKAISVTTAISPTPTLVSKKLSSQSTSPDTSMRGSSTVFPTVQPAPTAVTALNSSDPFITAINQYRATQGLGPVQTDPYTCAFAKTRAGEIVSNFSHEGFTSRMNSHTLPYPSYHEVTENIAMNSDPAQVVLMWIASPGHAANMRADTPYVCVQQSGNYFAYEGWKP